MLAFETIIMSILKTVNLFCFEQFLLSENEALLLQNGTVELKKQFYYGESEKKYVYLTKNKKYCK